MQSSPGRVRLGHDQIAGSTRARGCARLIPGSTVIGGMLAASGIAIFLIPVTFYIVERLAHRKHAVAPAAASPQPQPAPAAALPS